MSIKSAISALVATAVVTVGSVLVAPAAGAAVPSSALSAGSHLSIGLGRGQEHNRPSCGLCWQDH